MDTKVNQRLPLWWILILAPLGYAGTNLFHWLASPEIQELTGIGQYRIFSLLVYTLATGIAVIFFSPRMKAQPNTAKHYFMHKENGWYHVLSTGSLSSKPIITVRDFVGLKLEKDYFGKYAISGQISKHKLNKWADETEKSIGGNSICI